MIRINSVTVIVAKHCYIIYMIYIREKNIYVLNKLDNDSYIFLCTFMLNKLYLNYTLVPEKDLPDVFASYFDTKIKKLMDDPSVDVN
jgi:hypothetical protein